MTNKNQVQPVSVDRDFSSAPLVSCIMPTYNRREFVPDAVACFLSQDYENKELIILDDGSDAVKDLIPHDSRIRYYRNPRRETIGAKRNRACQLAGGEIIVHWDDDDWSAPFRLSYQVSELLHHDAHLCGASRILHWESTMGSAFWYKYLGRDRWVSGNTLCYLRRHWQRTPFRSIQVGEDTAFVRASRSARIISLNDTVFLVARIHSGNASPKQTLGRSWTSADSRKVYNLMGITPKASELAPLVSCIMPTYNRREFVKLSLAYFKEQTYPNLELIVVDDGSRSVRNLIPREDRFRYVRLPRRTVLGLKRNQAVSHARGQIIIHWDDDDWYAPERVATQVTPIVDGTADVTGLGMHHLLHLDGPELYNCSAELHQQLHGGFISPGSLAYRRSLWGKVRYPAEKLAEDATFLRCISKKARVRYIPDKNLYVMVRHGSNTWQFRDTPLQEEGYSPCQPSAQIAEDWTRYQDLSTCIKKYHAPVKAKPTKVPGRSTHRKRSAPSKLNTPLAPEFTIVINLESSTERAWHIRHQLKRNWSGPVAYFSGIDGRKLDLKAFRRQGYLKERAWLKRKLKPGEVGCWLSHLLVLQQIVYRDLNSALILEDDVQLEPQCSVQLAARLAQLGDTCRAIDGVFLGCNEGRGSWTPKAPKRLLPGGFFQLGKLNKGCQGTYAYMLTKNGAKKLLRLFCRGPIDQPVDEKIREFSERGMQIYCASPPLVVSSGHESDIQSRDREPSPGDPLEGPPKAYLACLTEFATRRWWR